MKSRPLARALGALRGPGLLAVLSRGAGGSLLVFVAGTGLATVSQAVLARLLGTEGFGVYAYSLSLLVLVTMAATLGMDTALVRFMAAYRVGGLGELMRGLLRFTDRCVALAGVGIGLGCAGAVWLLRGHLRAGLGATLLVACAVVVPWAFLGLRRGALEGLRKVAVGRVPDLVVRPVLIAVAAFAVHRVTGALSAPGAMGLNLLSTIAALALAEWVLRRVIPITRLGEVVSRNREWLRVSLPLLLVSGMRRLLQETDILLVGAILGTTSAGIYAVASRLSRLVSFGHNAGNVISAPLISELHSKGESRELQRIVTFACLGSTVSAVLGTLVLVGAGGFVLRLFGPDFTAAMPILLVLSLGQVVNALTGPVGYLLNMTGFQDVNARILAVITGLNLVLNLPAILLFGPLGAATTTALLTGLKNTWTWLAVRKKLGVNSSIFGGLKA